MIDWLNSRPDILMIIGILGFGTIGIMVAIFCKIYNSKNHK